MLKQKSVIEEGKIILFTIPAKKYLVENLKILEKYINKMNYNCIYVTVNRPYTSLMKILEEKKIDTSKIFIIDGITPVGFGMKKIGNALFLGSPRSLTNISIAAHLAMKKLDGSKTFLFLDSLSTLCLYNDNKNVSRFMHFLVNKMHDLNVSAALLSVEREIDEDMLSELSQFCDKLIEIK
jgi:archaellum biogenesis ATPase FlaH